MHVSKTEPEIQFLYRFYEENRCKLYAEAFGVLKDEEAAENAVCVCLTNVYGRYGEYCHMSYADFLQMCCVVVKCIACGKAGTQSHVSKGEKGGILPELEGEERYLAMLHYAYGLGNMQIARLTGVSPFEVRRKLLSGKNKLLKEVGNA